MAKGFLTIYVLINIVIVIINLVHNLSTGEVVQELNSDDWLIFIIACGTLAICETLEKGESE